MTARTPAEHAATVRESWTYESEATAETCCIYCHEPVPAHRVGCDGEEASAALDALEAQAEEAEAERDRLRSALSARNDYSRETGCDCHGLMFGKDGQLIGEKSMSDREFLAPLLNDPDYSPAYQDEYQRLWHREAAETKRLAVRVAELEAALRKIETGLGYPILYREVARAALATDKEQDG